MNDENNNLKLSCRSIDDLKVVSAHLQDSVVSVKDIKFLKNNKLFLMILNRFMWEDIEKGFFRGSKRIRSALKINNVLDVKSKNINQNKKNKALEFLAIETNLKKDNFYKINIIFSGDSIINIRTEEIDIFLDDFGKPRRVKHIPKHKI